MIIDTHAHYDDNLYDDDRDALLSQVKDKGIGTIINIGTNDESNKRSIKLAHTYEDMIYATVGYFPSEVYHLTNEDADRLIELSHDDKVVAIGEVGLDYHYPVIDKKMQSRWFDIQINIAIEQGLPLSIHSRDACADTIDIMKSSHADRASGVMHCYSYEAQTAKTLLDMGFSFGIGGVVTFKNSRKIKETVSYIPLESILLETDCPYLAPTPHRGQRNDSTYLSYVIDEISRIKNIDREQVIDITHDNAVRLFAKMGERP